MFYLSHLANANYANNIQIAQQLSAFRLGQYDAALKFHGVHKVKMPVSHLDPEQKNGICLMRCRGSMSTIYNTMFVALQVKDLRTLSKSDIEEIIPVKRAVHRNRLEELVLASKKYYAFRARYKRVLCDKH